MNAIARNFYEVAQAIKHEPDGITKEALMKAMTELLDRYVAAGALVTPRDKSQGEDPYVVQVVQKDIDLWKWPGLFVRPVQLAESSVSQF